MELLIAVLQLDDVMMHRESVMFSIILIVYALCASRE